MNPYAHLQSALLNTFACGTGRAAKRLTGSRYRNGKHTGEKICPCIAGRIDLAPQR